MVLKIRDWDRHFENAESRKLKALRWVAMPNHMQTQGYTSLVDHPDGAAHFGAWCAIVEICSAREPKERRGYLPESDGTIGGISRSLGRISRLPGKIFQDVIERLMSDPEIAWIEVVSETSGKSPETSGKSPETSGKSPETSGASRARSSLPFPSIPSGGAGGELEEIGAAAERMYARHPKKRDWVLVAPALEAAAAHADLEDIEECHGAWCDSDDWTKQNGRYCPPLARWLSDRAYTQRPEGDARNSPEHLRFLEQWREKWGVEYGEEIPQDVFERGGVNARPREI